MTSVEKTDESREVVWTLNERRALRHLLLEDGISFMRYFFRLREGNKMLVNWHHLIIEDTLQRVIDGEINRLIINIPPGYTKTEQAVLNFISRGLAINPRSKYIHVSYSGELAQTNSSKVKDTIESAEFQELFPMQLRTDSKGKKRWFTELGGGILTAPAGGQITGFRAGRMEKGFTGAFIIDDPVKPDDAYSVVRRSAINNRFNNTMRSRLAVETVPMIVIMQRIHEDDMSGFLLKGGSGDIWDHLVVPAYLTEEELSRDYPKDYTHGRKIDLEDVLQSRVRERRAFLDADGAVASVPKELPYEAPLWPMKHCVDDLEKLKAGDPYTFSSQMQQHPSPPGGGMFKDTYWRHYDVLPPDIDLMRIYCDTAQKTKEHNDYSVFQLWARSPTKGLFLVDQMRGKWEAPQLESGLVQFWDKHKPTQFKPFGAQLIKVEDKSSGSSLIQSIKQNYFIPIEPIQRHTDKVLRAMGVVKYFASGYIHVPARAEWIHDYKDEFRKFTPTMSHSHDDQIDPTMDAVEDMLVFSEATYNRNALS